jgi:hypothetical protein
MLEKIIKLIPATKKKTFDGVGSFNWESNNIIKIPINRSKK